VPGLQRLTKAREFLKVRVCKIDQADRLASGCRLERAWIEIEYLFRREDSKPTSANYAAGDIVRGIVVAGGDRAVSDPDCWRRIYSVRGESQVVVLPETSQACVDDSRTDIHRRRPLISKVCLQLRKHLVELRSLIHEVETGEVLIVESRPSISGPPKEALIGFPL
jgi:hypothetical protein